MATLTVDSQYDAQGTSSIGLYHDGEFLWQASTHPTDTIYKTTSSTGAVVDSWSAQGNNPAGVAIIGSTAYVSDYNTDTIHTHTAADGTLLSSFSVPEGPLDLDVEGSTLWLVAENNGAPRAYNLSTSGTVLSSFPIHSDPAGITLFKGNLLVGQFSSTDLYEYTTSGVLEWTHTLPDQVGTGLAYDGEFVYGVKTGEDIYLMSLPWPTLYISNTGFRFPYPRWT